MKVSRTGIVCALMLSAVAQAAPPGSGPMPSVMEVDPSLPNHTVYRPQKMEAVPKASLPIVAFGNGGCVDDGGGFRELLGEVASHGFLVIALGTPKLWPPPLPPAPPPGAKPGAMPEMRMPPGGIPPPATKASELITAIDWAIAENKRAGSRYNGRIDTAHVAVMGQSCGGLQALEVSADPRISTTVVLNSGIFNEGFPRMPGVTIKKDALTRLHAPVAYLLGGPSDIAYVNGMDDYNRITGVPVFVGNTDSGHMGTYWEPDGGRFAKVATAWLQWQLKSDAKAKHQFVGSDCGLCQDAQWTVASKGINAAGTADAKSPAAAPANIAASSVVRVKEGSLRGQALAEGGAVFKGIPYAAPPLGALRWREPAAVKSWQGTRDATANSHACMQPNQMWNAAPAANASEDCLYLNVWTPKVDSSAHLPVMVWIHGGGFTGGAGNESLFDGQHLVANGVILVTLNYRLGVFGFFSHPGLSGSSPYKTSGNYGLMDQVAALSWVRENIAQFGGDPQAITIFGQSAGGGSVVALLASPLSAGIARGAIVESGAWIGRGPLTSLKAAEALGARFAGKANIDELKAKPAADLLRSWDEFAKSDRTVQPGPVVDGRVLTDDPAVVFARHAEHNIPLIIGNNSREGFGMMEDAAVPGAVTALFGSDAPAVLPEYKAADPVMGPVGAQWLTDTTFRCSAVVMAARHATRGAPVYSYQFEQPLPGRESRGAEHSYELPFVFGNLTPEGMLGGPFSDRDRALSVLMLTYWTQFAKHGDPNGAGAPAWPRFDSSTREFVRFSTAYAGNVAQDKALRNTVCRAFEKKL